MVRVPSLALLAGERAGEDPLAVHHSVASKVLVPVGGETLILRVMRILGGIDFSERNLIGPSQATLAAAPKLGTAIDTDDWLRMEPAASPAASVVAALEAADCSAGVLVTTADHALLSAELVAEFLAGALHSDADLAIGFVRHTDVMNAFPEGRRTGWGFADGRYCGCNLFFFARPKAAAVAQLWRQVEQHRKRPWRVVSLLGFAPLWRFVTRRLTLADALARLGARTGTRIAPVFLSDPRAAVDVDSIADWQLVQRLVVSDAET